jgi:hypothetical protein
MPGFGEVFKETGVDSLNNFMVVGLRRSNMVLLRDARGFDYDHKKLEVSEVSRATAVHFSNILFAQFRAWGLGNEDSAKSYWQAVHAVLNFGAHTRVLFVTGKVQGTTEIKAVLGGLKQGLSAAVVPQLSAAVLPPQYFTIAFKFVQLVDETGATSMTQWQPNDAQWLISKLNWIYGPQANITFELKGADGIKVPVNSKQVDVSKPLKGQDFLKYVVGQKSLSADWTIFFVRKYVSVDGRGLSETFTGEKACVVEDDPALPVVNGADPFVVNFAHEVAHFVLFQQDPNPTQDVHHDRPDILLSRKIQSSRLDRKLVLEMNPP